MGIDLRGWWATISCAGRQKSLGTTDIQSCLLKFFSIESGPYKIQIMRMWSAALNEFVTPALNSKHFVNIKIDEGEWH